MMLTAAILGIGSCPATLHSEESVRLLLGVPDDRPARHAIAFGYPHKDLEPTVRGNMRLITGSKRKPLGELVRRNRCL